MNKKRSDRVREVEATYGAESVGVAELKNQLSEYLRKVKRGMELIVLDHETPIAKLVPMPAPRSTFRLIPPKKPYKDIINVKLHPPLKTPVDIMSILLEDRKDRFP